MSDQLKELSLEVLEQAVASSAAAFRCVTEYQPAGGPGDKVFPPTYEGGKYAVETRVIDGQPVPCVLLDSVQSQANRMELTLLEAVRDKSIELPLVVVHFNDERLKKKFSVTSLEAPHRVADALFRDSVLGNVIFRKSDKGQLLDHADVRNATGLFGLCPTALLFGLWDSTGPRGGMGAKFQRAMVSELVGIQSLRGIATGGKVDSVGILIKAGTLYQRKDASAGAPTWTLNAALAREEKGKKVLVGKEGKPSEVNLGGVTPDFAYAKQNNRMLYEDDGTPRIKGGFTVVKALQATVLSLTALRRLRFPLNGASDSDHAVDVTARTVLAALGLLAAAQARYQSADLRSRCHLVAIEKPLWELLETPGETPKRFQVTGTDAVGLFNDAVAKAKKAGLPWENEISLRPSDELLELVCRSQELSATIAEGEE